MSDAMKRLVDRLLGERDQEGPSSAELLGYLEGEEGRTREDCERFLADNSAVAAALKAGLAALQDETAELELEPAPLAVAAADEELAPFPEDRKLLWEEEGHRLVYHQHQQRAQLMFYGTRSMAEEVQLTLDGEPLDGREQTAGTLRFDLGALGALWGMKLEFRWRARDGSWQGESWVLIPLERGEP